MRGVNAGETRKINQVGTAVTLVYEKTQTKLR